MALTKRLNYYIDANSRIRRIPWDTWFQDGSFAGLSPVPIATQSPFEFDANGSIKIFDDFLYEGEGGDITNLVEQTDEYAFLDEYDDVCFFYESKDAQTYETDYHETSRNE